MRELRCDRCDVWYEPAEEWPSRGMIPLCPRCVPKGALNSYSKEELWAQLEVAGRENIRAREVNGTEQVAAIHALLDEFWGTNQWAPGRGRPANANAEERVAMLLDGWRHPKNKTALVCVQLLNAVRHMRGHLQCECPEREGVSEDEHLETCVCWRADFLIAKFQDEFFPEDAEIWMRVCTLLNALQEKRRRGTAIGYTAVPEVPLDELVEIANGNPAAVTDAYAAMETLRATVAKMTAHADEPAGNSKLQRIRRRGYREAIKRFLPEIEGVVDPMATDICAGLVLAFGAWLTTRPETIEVGAKAVAGPMAELVEEFTRINRLRRTEQKE